MTVNFPTKTVDLIGQDDPVRHVDDSTLEQVESPRCCKSAAIRKKRSRNIGRNGSIGQ